MAIGKIFFQKSSLHIEINVRYVVVESVIHVRLLAQRNLRTRLLNVIQYFSCNVAQSFC